jgi:hypothetical protein
MLPSLVRIQSEKDNHHYLKKRLINQRRFLKGIKRTEYSISLKKVEH